MLNIGIQFFGGRGGGGSGGARGGRAGGGSSSEETRMVNRLVNEGMTEQAARHYVTNERRASELERELAEEMSSTEDRHSVGWRRNMQEQISQLRKENKRLRWGR